MSPEDIDKMSLLDVLNVKYNQVCESEGPRSQDITDLEILVAKEAMIVIALVGAEQYVKQSNFTQNEFGALFLVRRMLMFGLPESVGYFLVNELFKVYGPAGTKKIPISQN